MLEQLGKDWEEQVKNAQAALNGMVKTAGQCGDLRRAKERSLQQEIANLNARLRGKDDAIDKLMDMRTKEMDRAENWKMGTIVAIVVLLATIAGFALHLAGGYPA